MVSHIPLCSHGTINQAHIQQQKCIYRHCNSVLDLWCHHIWQNCVLIKFWIFIPIWPGHSSSWMAEVPSACGRLSQRPTLPFGRWALVHRENNPAEWVGSAETQKTQVNVGVCSCSSPQPLSDEDSTQFKASKKMAGCCSCIIIR